MRIALAGLSHETQTSLPGKTDMEAFTTGAQWGEEMLEQHMAEPNSAVGRAASVFTNAGAEVVPLVYASGGVGPTVTDDVYEYFAGEICTGLQAMAVPPDGVLLVLHGAMVTESRQDPELDLVREVREVVGDHVPVMLTLDLHANISPDILDASTGVFGYHCSPHIDVGDTGERAARTMLQVLHQEVAPVAAMSEPGLVIPSLYSATTQWPASEVQQRVRQWAGQPDVVDVSFFFGFAWSDVSQLGASAVAITDDNPELAERIAADLSDLAWSHRKSFTHQSDLYSVREGVALAIQRAQTAARPVIILDHADRMQDTTFVLHELLKQGAGGAAHPLLYDPEAVELCMRAGAGAEVEVMAGSRSSERAGGPVHLCGGVLWAGEIEYLATGPMTEGRSITHGPTAILDVDGVWVQLVSRRSSLIDTDPIEKYGWSVEDFNIIVSKSKTHFRAVYEDVADEIIVVDAPEYSPADLTGHCYQNAPPELYPLCRG